MQFSRFGQALFARGGGISWKWNVSRASEKLEVTRNENSNICTILLCLLLDHSLLVTPDLTEPITDLQKSKLRIPFQLVCDKTGYTLGQQQTIRKPMRVMQMTMEQRRNERSEEMRDFRENPPTSGIVRHDSHGVPHEVWSNDKRIVKLGSPLVDDRPIMNSVKYGVASVVVWTNRTMVSSNTYTNRTGVLAVVDIETQNLADSFGNKIDSKILRVLEPYLDVQRLMHQFHRRKGRTVFCPSLFGSNLSSDPIETERQIKVDPHLTHYCLVVNTRRHYQSLCEARGEKDGVAPPPAPRAPGFNHALEQARAHKSELASKAARANTSRLGRGSELHGDIVSGLVRTNRKMISGTAETNTNDIAAVENIGNSLRHCNQCQQICAVLKRVDPVRYLIHLRRPSVAMKAVANCPTRGTELSFPNSPRQNDVLVKIRWDVSVGKEMGLLRENPSTIGNVRHVSPHSPNDSDLPGCGVVVVKPLPTKAGRVSIPGTVAPACGNRTARCRLSAGFLGHLPLLSSLHSGALTYSPRFILIGSQDLHYTVCMVASEQNALGRACFRRYITRSSKLISEDGGCWEGTSRAPEGPAVRYWFRVDMFTTLDNIVGSRVRWLSAAGSGGYTSRFHFLSAVLSTEPVCLQEADTPFLIFVSSLNALTVMNCSHPFLLTSHSAKGITCSLNHIQDLLNDRCKCTSASAYVSRDIPALRALRCRRSASFLGNLPFPPPCILALPHNHLASRSSALNTSMLRMSLLTHSCLLHRHSSKLDPRSDLRSKRKTVAPFEFRAGLEIEMKFISNRRNCRFEISIRDQQPSSTNVVESEIRSHEICPVQHFYIGTKIKPDPDSELGSLDLGSGKKMSAQPGPPVSRRGNGGHDCVGKRTQYLLTNLEHGKVYHLDVFAVNKKTNLSFSYGRTALKYDQRGKPTSLRDGKPAKVNLRKLDGRATFKFKLRAVHDKVSTFEMNLRKKSLPPACIYFNGCTEWHAPSKVDNDGWKAVPYLKVIYKKCKRHDGNTARLACRSDEALGVRVSVARIAPSLIVLGRREHIYQQRGGGDTETKWEWRFVLFVRNPFSDWLRWALGTGLASDWLVHAAGHYGNLHSDM
ncbi:hypothetical protein PR048_032417 [Dryococelus australis]|uniref:Neuron-derived neurotrophic factor first Fn(III) domain-containing protein n=1 Tax=Dryococelus australis TaxID=614101 RepID=A0ABQ9G245_9NEOP|nr:hypothetical protein PR048_032417 [Dryococelus australis]